MKVCAVIFRKAKVALPDANYLSSRCQSQSPRAQNRGFCALVTGDVGLDVVIVGFGNVILNVGN